MQIAEKSFRGSHLAAPCERAAERDLVRVLEVAADGKPARKPCHANSSSQPIREEGSRGLPGHGRVRGEDDLLDAAVLDTRLEAPDPEVRRLHAVEGRQRTPENVVEAAELECPLERDDVDRLLDHADDRAVAARVRADGAKLFLREVSAFAAEADARLDLLDGSRKLDGVLRACGEEMEGQPLRCPAPDARQLRELGDEVLDGRAERQTFVGRPEMLSTRDSLEIERERLMTLRERLSELAEHVAHVALNKSTPIANTR